MPFTMVSKITLSALLAARIKGNFVFILASDLLRLNQYRRLCKFKISLKGKIT